MCGLALCSFMYMYVCMYVSEVQLRRLEPNQVRTYDLQLSGKLPSWIHVAYSIACAGSFQCLIRSSHHHVVASSWCAIYMCVCVCVYVYMYMYIYIYIYIHRINAFARHKRMRKTLHPNVSNLCEQGHGAELFDRGLPNGRWKSLGCL